MQNCTNCGQVNYDNQTNCGRCGMALIAPNFAPNQPNFVPSQSNFNQPNFNQPTNFNQPMPAMLPKKSNVGKILGIIGGSILALGLVVGGIIFLLVTQTAQWKITEKWRIDSASMGGISAPLGEGQGTTVKFNWDQSFVTTLPNGTTERGTYKVINNQTVSTTDRNNQTITYTLTFDRNKMTLMTTKNNLNISINYSRVPN